MGNRNDRTQEARNHFYFALTPPHTGGTHCNRYGGCRRAARAPTAKHTERDSVRLRPAAPFGRSVIVVRWGLNRYYKVALIERNLG
jgi:hypothetical protein